MKMLIALLYAIKTMVVYWDNEYCLCSDLLYTFNGLISAPTAEEVPLPKEINGYDLIIYNNHVACITYEKQNFCDSFDILVKADIDDDNEATARLKMATWLIENVPEAKQWYIDSGYLVLED